MNITAYDGASYRLERLNKCARLIALMLGVTVEQLGALIESLNDHKGLLEVRWFHKPSSKAKMAADDAWRECKETLTDHWWPGMSERNTAGRERV